MAKIKVTSKCAVYDGLSITFKAPCDSASADGINVYHNGVKKAFTIRDAHGADLANKSNLFTAGSYVKVILDTTKNYAYLQNADTNSYIEASLSGYARFAYGSYVGEGNDAKVGKSITFDFEPKLFMINTTYLQAPTKGNGNLFWMEGPKLYQGSDSAMTLTVTRTGNTLSWKAPWAGDGEHICDKTGTTYYWVAFGI